LVLGAHWGFLAFFIGIGFYHLITLIMAVAVRAYRTVRPAGNAGRRPTPAARFPAEPCSGSAR
jgi:hypothetical protein